MFKVEKCHGCENLDRITIVARNSSVTSPEIHYLGNPEPNTYIHTYVYNM